MLIFHERQLVHVLAEYEKPQHTHRLHRALEQHSRIDCGDLTFMGEQLGSADSCPSAL